MARSYRVAVIGRTGKGNYGHGLGVVWNSFDNVEVVAVADEQGRLLSSASTDALLERMLDKLEQIRFEMELRNA